MAVVEVVPFLNSVREKKPLVHHITNWVTIYDCANVVRAFGALPVMAHAKEEVEEMAGIANALVLNIGTLTPELVEAMILAGKAANKKGIPVVLDCVGVGATSLRNEKAVEILEKVKVSIIKGNSSEIAKTAGAKAHTRGVEAAGVEGDLKLIAKNFAKNQNAVVVVSGKEDIVTDGKRVFLVKNGCSQMGGIVGTGCMLASVLGAFAGAAEKNRLLDASIAALVCFEVAGELAARQSKGPGTFKERFYDEIASLDASQADSMKKVEEVS